VITVVAVVIAAVAVVGVLGARDPADGSVPVASLAEVTGTWQAVDDVGAPATLVATVTLDVVTEGLFVRTGCNSGRAPAHVEDSHLVLDVDDLATTRKLCEPTLMAQEQWVLDMLRSRPRLARSGPTVSLLWGENERYSLGFEVYAPQVTRDPEGPSTGPSV
jgi:heat shock protein HslJ